MLRIICDGEHASAKIASRVGPYDPTAKQVKQRARDQAVLNERSGSQGPAL